MRDGTDGQVYLIRKEFGDQVSPAVRNSYYRRQHGVR